MTNVQLSLGKVMLSRGAPGETARDLRGVPESPLQEITAVGAASMVFRPRGNKKTTLTFTVDRTHESAEDAADFCVRHETQFPVQGLFTYRTDRGELYLPGAVASVTQYSFRGASTTHAYRVVGGSFLTKLPTSAD